MPSPFLFVVYVLTMNSADLEWIFGTKITRKLKKLDTFPDAITYLLTEGVFQSADIFLDNYRNVVESATTGSRGDLPVRLNTAGMFIPLLKVFACMY
jgi:hypothetical protein